MVKDKKSDDSFYMQLALKEAKRGRYTTSPNPAVGCVIVRDGHILGQGFHHCAGQPHAEVMALRAANYEVAGATVYVTLEPCSHYGRTPPCAKALCEAQVKRVVIGSTDPNPKVSGRGIKMLEDAGIKVSICTGKIHEKCLKLNRAFFKSIQTGRPYTFLKFGLSMDGKIALSDGASKWITNAASRADVQRLRLWADAIITSRSTVLSDNPRMTVRVEELPGEVLEGLDTTLIRQPLKVIIDSHGKLCAKKERTFINKLNIFSQGISYIVVGTHQNLSELTLPQLNNTDIANPVAVAVAVPEDKVAQTTGADKAVWTKAGNKDSSAEDLSESMLQNLRDEVQRTNPRELGWVVDPAAVIEVGRNFVVEKWTSAVSIVVVPLERDDEGYEHVALEPVLDFLGSKNIRTAMVEAGSRLGSTFLQQGLIDECYCYFAPMFLGKEAKSAFNLTEPLALSEALRFNRTRVKQFGNNVLMIMSEPVIRPQVSAAHLLKEETKGIAGHLARVKAEKVSASRRSSRKSARSAAEHEQVQSGDNSVVMVTVNAFEVDQQAAPKAAKSSRSSRTTAQKASETKADKAVKSTRSAKTARAVKAVKETRATKDTKAPKATKETKAVKETRTAKDSKATKGTRTGKAHSTDKAASGKDS